MSPSRGPRKPRKSRGKGLRTTTGCATCKRRHLKCDELRPQCGPCAKGNRACVYTDARPVPDEVDLDHDHDSPHPPVSAVQPSPLHVLVDACEQERPSPIAHAHVSPTSHVSPATDYSTPSSAAPRSWFELLASDAVNADHTFILSPPSNANLHPKTPLECQSFQAASFDIDPELEHVPPENARPAALLPDEPASWTTPSPIDLSEIERRLFRHFVRTISTWIDYFDPAASFSTTVPHLALPNTGLMNALLALSARHVSRSTPDHPPHDPSLSSIDRNAAVQYYYETLSYLNRALQYPSYAASEEVIVTAILISTYEMIDGSNRDWERHLKGVFWLQRFQNSNGDCGGIRQAAWWAWLRQDVWVAMRCRRRVLSFWKPKRPVQTRAAAELAVYANYLLAQCVNYASREECAHARVPERWARGNELLAMLQEWEDFLPREFTPLSAPVVDERPFTPGATIFPPIWVHPPPYASALQIHSLARILVLMHRPSMGEMTDYQVGQKILSSSVYTIAGIARMVPEDDIAANLIALQCLVAAAMAVQSPHETEAMRGLVEVLQRRANWPVGGLSELREDRE